MDRCLTTRLRTPPEQVAACFTQKSPRLGPWGRELSQRAGDIIVVTAGGKGKIAPRTPRVRQRAPGLPHEAGRRSRQAGPQRAGIPPPGRLDLIIFLSRLTRPIPLGLPRKFPQLR